MYATWKSYTALTDNGTKYGAFAYKISADAEWGYKWPWLSSPANRSGQAQTFNVSGAVSMGRASNIYTARPALYHLRIIINGLL